MNFVCARSSRVHGDGVVCWWSTKQVGGRAMD